jgi:enoyl-CoA hydratase/carnithine racemase
MPQPSAAPVRENAILLRDDREGIATLRLNRPASRNSLSLDMVATLHSALDEIAADRGVRAVILAANGPGFCAGHDMKEMTARRADPDRGAAFFRELFDNCSAMMLAIVALPQPVIACVQGAASAAGCQLVATCDLAVASERATFATPGVNIGLFCSTPMVALSRNVSNKHAMEMLLTGESVSAAHAKEIGLVNRVVSAGQELAETEALARLVASKSSHTVKIGKQAFYRQKELDLAAAYRYTAEVMAENMLARDAEEGIGAFVEKRAPNWEDR